MHPRQTDKNDSSAAGASTPPPPLCLGYRFTKIHQFDPAQVSAFAHAAGDSNPLHHDRAAAARSRYGQPIASGTHTTALLMGLAASHLSTLTQVVGVSFTMDLLRPVFADEQVVLAWEVTAIQAHPRGGHYLDLAGAVNGMDGECRVRGLGRVLVWR